MAGLEAGPEGCGNWREALAPREVRRRQKGAADRRVP